MLPLPRGGVALLSATFWGCVPFEKALPRRARADDSRRLVCRFHVPSGLRQGTPARPVPGASLAYRTHTARGRPAQRWCRGPPPIVGSMSLGQSRLWTTLLLKKPPWRGRDDSSVIWRFPSPVHSWQNALILFPALAPSCVL